MGFQKTIIAGNIGKLKELRYTASGKAVCNFSVGVTEGFDKDHTEWFQVEVWDKTAEAVTKFLQVGSYVIVEGRLKTRKWEDRDGQARYSTDLKASRVEFGPGATQGDSPAPQQERPAQSQPAAQSGGFGDDGGEIPF